MSYIVYRWAGKGKKVYEASFSTRYEAMKCSCESYERHPFNSYSWTNADASDADAIKNNAKYIAELESRIVELERANEMLHNKLDDLQYHANRMEAYIDGII